MKLLDWSETGRIGRNQTDALIKWLLLNGAYGSNTIKSLLTWIYEAIGQIQAAE